MTTNTSGSNKSSASAQDLAFYLRNALMMDVSCLAQNASLVLQDLVKLRAEQDLYAAEGAFGLMTASVLGLCAARPDSAEAANLKVGILSDFLTIYRNEHPLLATIVEAAAQVERHRWWPH